MSGGNKQKEKIVELLERMVTSDDPPVVVIFCETHCAPIIESYTGNVTLAVSWFQNFVLCADLKLEDASSPKLLYMLLIYAAVPRLCVSTVTREKLLCLTTGRLNRRIPATYYSRPI